MLAGVPTRPAYEASADHARTAVAEAAGKMGRSMPAGILHELMAASADAERWDDVASRSAFELDGPDVMALCDRHPELGYQLALRMLDAAVRRLQATRIRLLDLYGAPGQKAEVQ